MKMDSIRDKSLADGLVVMLNNKPYKIFYAFKSSDQSIQANINRSMFGSYKNSGGGARTRGFEWERENHV